MRIVPSFVTQWKNALGFKSLPVASKSIVFYSEGKPSSPHLGPLIQELVDRGRSVQLLISDRDDPLADKDDPRIESHWIGTGSARTWVYSGLEASVFVTTTPDIETMQLKRSKHGVYYIYAHHSMISTHMGYRPGAFDHFDAIFCTGPHHVEETRAHEARQGLPGKTLLEQGYCRLDTLRAASENSARRRASEEPESAPTVLLAPTWGVNSILPTCGEELIEILLRADYRVVLRPHPETTRKSSALIRAISDRFGEHAGFGFDGDPTGDASMHRADLMISDWSGVAMEYAYGFEKPVLFIDLPRKVNNPAYVELEIEPMEVTVRNEVGETVGLNELVEVPDMIDRLIPVDPGRVNDIRRSYEKRVFSRGSSAGVGADFIEKIVDERQ